MRRYKILILFVCIPLLPIFSFAGNLVITPTTTLYWETNSNTSAAPGFTSQSNGNLGGANVSKADVHSLLYAGASTKVYAHLLLWFGGSNHMNVGYDSADPAQVKRQIQDMIGRGIDGVIIDWYGPGNSIDQATRAVMVEAEAHPGFTFAIMVDQGAIRWFPCAGCNPEQSFISDLRYVEQNYFPSPAYLRVSGKPVVADFGIADSYSINWDSVNASLDVKPMFIFQNAGGFSHELSGGAYAWVIPTTSDYGLGYLNNFYLAGNSAANSETVGGTYKGFNDTLAAWGSNRVMQQQCGKTWLQTFDEVNSLYSTNRQLPALQLVTWNDYEEATEIETGIDNCLTVAADLQGNTLSWNVSGDESTVFFYKVYISNDGQNLMQLDGVPVQQHSLDLCKYSPSTGNYTLYVQAVGKPSIRNQISRALPYAAECGETSAGGGATGGGGNPAPTGDGGTTTSGPAPSGGTTGTGSGTTSVAAPVAQGLDMTVSAGAISVARGQSASVTITVSPKVLPFNDPVSLSCSGLPQGASCAFSPQAVTPGNDKGAATLTISTASMTAWNSRTGGPNSNRQRSLPLYTSFLLSASGLVLAGDGKRNCAPKVAASGLVLLLGFLLGSCGGQSAQQSTIIQSDTANYTVTISGNSGQIQGSTTTMLTIH